jgi:hypothetical protein
MKLRNFCAAARAAWRRCDEEVTPLPRNRPIVEYVENIRVDDSAARRCGHRLVSSRLIKHPGPGLASHPTAAVVGTTIGGCAASRHRWTKCAAANAPVTIRRREMDVFKGVSLKLRRSANCREAGTSSLLTPRHCHSASPSAAPKIPPIPQAAPTLAVADPQTLDQRAFGSR